jgi:nucleotide-binding universal stress UspA family protein
LRGSFEEDAMSVYQRYKKIVVPLDGSGWARRAVPHAVDIARANDSELILLHVFRAPVSDYMPEITLAGQETQIQQIREQMKQYLIGLRTELRDENQKVRTQLIEGPGVANAICDYVNEEGADLIVMSTHGRTGIARFFMGSIANQVMQCANVPVLLIRPDKE